MITDIFYLPTYNYLILIYLPQVKRKSDNSAILIYYIIVYNNILKKHRMLHITLNCIIIIECYKTVL